MSQRITDSYLSELERLGDAAAPGPWTADHTRADVESYAVIHPTGTVCIESEDQPGDFDQELRDLMAADFAFIAAARVAIPALVAEVRRLRAVSQR